MLLLKYLLLVSGAGLFAGAALVIASDLYRSLRPVLTGTTPPAPTAPWTMVRWAHAGRLAALGCVPLVAALSIVVVPTGFAGVRLSQLSGTLPGTLYP